MGAHDQPTKYPANQTAIKLALSASTVAGVLTFSNMTSADSYTVKAGDTLWDIAQTFNTSVESLVSYNNVSDATQISPGQVIETGQAVITPPLATQPEAEVKTEPKTTTQPAVTYTVKAGDTLWDIAQAHQISLDTLMSNSNISEFDYIYAGQVLIIQPKVVIKRPEPVIVPAVTYQVKAGDTLWDIAIAEKVSIEEIVKNSNLSQENYIYIGQELIIKPARTIYAGNISLSAETLGQQTGLTEARAQDALDIANHLMVEEGFTLEGVAGALAVAERESGFNPQAVNDSGGVAGIFQWSGWSNEINGNRWANAESQTLSLDVQLALTSYELNNAYRHVKDLVGQATDPKQASLDWSLYYEGVALSDSQTKADDLQENAQKWYDLLKDYVGSGILVPIDVTQGPYSTNNHYAVENCTWFVKDIFQARMGDWWGNAKDWAASAQREGLTVDDNPVANLTIAVFQPGSAGADAQYGHVAVVVDVFEDSVVIMEMNGLAGFGKTNTRSIPKTAATYIHMDS